MAVRKLPSILDHQHKEVRKNYFFIKKIGAEVCIFLTFFLQLFKIYSQAFFIHVLWGSSKEIWKKINPTNPFL